MLSIIFSLILCVNSYADFGEITILVSEGVQQDLAEQGVEANMQTFHIVSNPIASLNNSKTYYISSEIGGYQNIVTGLLVQYRCTSALLVETVGVFRVTHTDCDVLANNSYLNYPELSLLISTINASAEGEGHLTILEHSQRGRNWPCAATTYKTSEQVLRDFNQIIEESYTNDNENYETLKITALSQLQTLLGPGKYNYCSVTNENKTTYVFIGEVYQFSVQVK